MRHAPGASDRHLARHHPHPHRLRRRIRRRTARRVLDPRLGDAEGDRSDRVRVLLRAGRRPERRLRRTQGESLDTPERQAAIEDLVAKLQTDEFAPSGDKVGIENVADPFEDETISDDGRIGYLQAQFNDVITDKDHDQVLAVEDAARETLEPVGLVVEFNGEAEFPPLEQGLSRPSSASSSRCSSCSSSSGSWVATTIPIALALTALLTAFLLLFLLAGLTDINTVTPILVSMIGLGVGIDYSLFIITRFRQLLHGGLSRGEAATEAGASAGRAVLFAGLTVAISVSGLALIGLDFVTKLGIGSALGILADGADRQLAPDLGAREDGEAAQHQHRDPPLRRHLRALRLALGVQRHQYAKRETGSGLGGWLGLIVWVLLRPVAAFLVPHAVGKTLQSTPARKRASRRSRVSGSFRSAFSSRPSCCSRPMSEAA